jgi:hypothetical protein
MVLRQPPPHSIVSPAHPPSLPLKILNAITIFLVIRMGAIHFPQWRNRSSIYRQIVGSIQQKSKFERPMEMFCSPTESVTFIFHCCHQSFLSVLLFKSLTFFSISLDQW